MKRPITVAIALALVLLVITGLAWVAGEAYANAGETSGTVDNETITADVGNWTEVTESPDPTWDYEDNETVWNSSDVELSEGDSDGAGDYDWNESDGTIRFHNTAKVSDGESMNITYTWNQKVETARAYKGVLDLVIPVLPLAVLGVFGIGMAGIVIFGSRRLLGAVGRTGGGGLGR